MALEYTTSAELTQRDCATAVLCQREEIQKARVNGEVGVFRWGVGHFERRFQREGGIAHQPLLVSEN